MAWSLSLAGVSVYGEWRSRIAACWHTRVQFVGLVPRLREAFPGIEIWCFALVRTRTAGEIDRILDPVEGTITDNRSEFHRHP
jgi:hypothetical protein